MVTFKLVEQTDESIIYHYYPQGIENECFGIIRIDLLKNDVFLEKLAVDDYERIITKEELNEMRASINEIRIENGETALSEDELPTAKEDIISRRYADHAIRRIWEEYKKGAPLKKGKVAWY